MVVICKRETKRLLKGVRYEVQNLWNDGSNQRWIEGKVQIKGIGRFVVDNFTDINGNSLPKINFKSNDQNSISILKFEDIKNGDIVVCCTDLYKTIVNGGLYKIEEKREFKKKFLKYTITEKYIKLLGIKRELKFNPFRFRALTQEEARNISLSEILEGSKPNIIETSDIRKIDMISNKEAELIKALSRSILDTKRHHLSIIDWACLKSSGNMGVVKEDYKELLNLTLSEIIKKIENE